MKNPIVSVITAVKDDTIGLDETYASLQKQSFNDWEMIIVASSSSKSTIERATHLQQLDSRVKLHIQEPQGIYEAMNLGLANINGNLTWFMNAGDRYASEKVLDHAVTTINKYDCGIVIGGYQLGRKEKVRFFKFKSKIISRMRFAFNLRMSHQSMIFSSLALRNNGDYDLNYRFASDFDLILKLMKSYEVRTSDEIYSIFRPGGAADQNIFTVHKEKHISRLRNFKNPIVWLLSFLWTFSARLKIKMRMICETKN